MDASVVYNVAKALSKEEQIKLYTMLKKDVSQLFKSKRKKEPIITDQEAIQYLISNIFNKRVCSPYKFHKGISNSFEAICGESVP